MKNYTFYMFLVLLLTQIYGQWTPVNTDLSNLQVTSMFAYEDTIVVGTSGGGIFKSINDGNSWINVNGDLPNLQINDVRGGGNSKIIWASTEDGAYITFDQSSYTLASEGIPTSDISFYWLGNRNEGETDWLIGTNGNGVYTSPEITGPWTERNNGLTGEALNINDITGYRDEITYTALATENGVFYSTDSMRTWNNISSSLSGDQLKVNGILMLGVAILIATDGGYYATIDFGATWIDGIINEHFNIINTTTLGPGGFYYLMGENAFYSFDLQSWTPISLIGVTGGKINSSAASSKYLFIGTETGGVFRKELQQVTSVNEISKNDEIPQFYSLEQNYPNPFNPSTKIQFSIPKAGEYSLRVYNTLGQEIQVLANQQFQPGKYNVEFNASDLVSGVYVYRLSGGNAKISRKMLLIK